VEVDWKRAEQKKAEREQEKQWWRAGSGTKAQEGEV
jgi:hypothetical protein